MKVFFIAVLWSWIQGALGENLQVTLTVLSPHDPPLSLQGPSLTLDPRRKAKYTNTNVSLPSWIFEDWPPGTLYKLQVQVGTRGFLTSVPLCRLQSARFQETLTLHLDSKKSLLHADVLTPSVSCSPGILIPKSRSFKTAIELVSVSPGRRPVLETMPDTPDGQPVPPTSFWSRYWYYIVPFLIVMLLPTGEAPPQAAASQRRSK